VEHCFVGREMAKSSEMHEPLLRRRVA